MTNTHRIALAALILSLCISVWQFAGQIAARIGQPSGMALHNLADQFLGLKPVFAGIPRAGYYTDKNLDIPLAIAQYEQAQYVLAPTVLELNNTNFPLIIFDCSTPAAALAKIKELGLSPLSASSTGIILALNPAFKK